MPEVSALQASEETEFTLTFQQPWATLIAIGAKQYEGTVLPPDASMIGKRIAIMAATNRAGDRCQTHSNTEAVLKEALCRAGIRDLPYGTIVGTAVLRAAWHAKTGVSKRRRVELDDEVAGSTLGRPRSITLSPQELLFGDFRGRCWLWRFEDPLLSASEWRAGRVKRFDDKRGFGFIRYGSRDVFLHLSTLIRAGVMDVLPEQPIEFQCEHGPKGLRATAVKLPLDITGMAACPQLLWKAGPSWGCGMVWGRRNICGMHRNLRLSDLRSSNRNAPLWRRAGGALRTWGAVGRE